MNKTLFALLLTTLTIPAHADNRALLIGVGDYQMKTANLPGIGKDLAMMKQNALALGFQAGQIKTLQDSEATLANVEHALQTWLVEGVATDDKVLLYYSGHGTYVSDHNGDEADKVDEALTMHDMKPGKHGLDNLLLDDRLETLLAKIPSQQVLVLIDACHSASATRTLQRVKDAVPKTFVYDGMPTPLTSRANGVKPKPIPANLITLSAAKDDELSTATDKGSTFTLGLNEIIQTVGDVQQLTPAYLLEQVAAYIERNTLASSRFHPQLTTSGNLSQQPFLVTAPSQAAAKTLTEQFAKLVNVAQPLETQLDQDRYTLGQSLHVTVSVPNAGYLNIVVVDANDAVTVLFPNQYKPDNRVESGNFTLPNDKMAFDLQAQDPLGRTDFFAFLSSEPLNLYRDGGTSDQLFKALNPAQVAEFQKRGAGVVSKQHLFKASHQTVTVCNTSNQCQ